MSADRAFREDVLRDHGAIDQDIAPLLAYTENRFNSQSHDLPMGDEACVAAWASYASEAEERPLLDVLRDHLWQLRFPIAPGVSVTDLYRKAGRTGTLPVGLTDLVTFNSPQGIRLTIHDTAAGRVPVIIAGDRRDFVTLVQALAHRNEPQPIPNAMGACIVGGYTNWTRARAFCADWLRAQPECTATDAMRALKLHKELYQDRFILLSSGPYSGVAAKQLALTGDTWSQLSLRIRLEHECAHYVTRRVFGSMKNLLHDELIADYVGVRAALGHFRADWLLRFLGLEDHPHWRRSGRIGSYRGDPALSNAAFAVVQSLVVAAAVNLEAADRDRGAQPHDALELGHDVVALASLSLEEMAGIDGADRIRSAFHTSVSVFAQ